jgi:hypothetical protein
MFPDYIYKNFHELKVAFNCVFVGRAFSSHPSLLENFLALVGNSFAHLFLLHLSFLVPNDFFTTGPGLPLLPTLHDQLNLAKKNYPTVIQ